MDTEAAAAGRASKQAPAETGTCCAVVSNCHQIPGTRRRVRLAYEV
jgi:hypothetical protein